MDRINVFFKIIICSLILIFYRSFFLLKAGIVPFFDLFGYPNHTLDSILFNILNLISVLGSLILFYSLTKFFMECVKFLRKDKNS